MEISLKHKYIVKRSQEYAHIVRKGLRVERQQERKRRHRQSVDTQTDKAAEKGVSAEALGTAQDHNGDNVGDHDQNKNPQGKEIDRLHFRYSLRSNVSEFRLVDLLTRDI